MPEYDRASMKEKGSIAAPFLSCQDAGAGSASSCNLKHPGHGNPESTKIYLSTDLEHLRVCALPLDGIEVAQEELQ